MQQFLIGLQFLTRIQVVTQTVWTEEDFGKSVRYFPLVGAVLGAIYGLVAWGATYLLPQVGVVLPHHLLLAVMVALPIILTGGIHCDGFMDTVDGIFSGRERERMLEIMKDSRVGAFGVVAFVLLVMFQYSALADVPEVDLPAAMFVMPIISRMMMVMAISLYPYARKEGMGKAFSEYSSKKTFILVFIYGLALVLPWGVKALIAVLVSLLFTACFCNYVTKKLGGVTGDVYGAVCTLCELLVLIAFTCKIPF
ncbi:Cobalamin synthase [Anaerovibrio sp. JC8]|uniref:adenosylcobinamide-GDP ribazoletransferase n=1 Tax=Anaerovibrio sp. JC8 TaxID=1240085 RepID=UPI000A0A8D67|nr:adenosylcobinamide-GDP ribazoletransferase [Anaerovibrio sp. JC8]ORT99536.1 Cobalamin synthase [Anaerovibrio sp. JC8]